jgi:hypothetical protein
VEFNSNAPPNLAEPSLRGVLTRNPGVGSGGPDVDIEAQSVQTTNQRLGGVIAIDRIEVTGSEILVEGAVPKRVVGSRYRVLVKMERPAPIARS